VAKLTDVDPAGRSILVSCGVATGADGPEWTVALAPTCYRFAAGHRLRLVLSDADFPRLWPAPNPRPLRVTGLGLTIPVLADEDGVPADLAASDAPPVRHSSLGLLDRPRWEITRDLVQDGVTITVGEEVAALTPQDGHLLQLDSSIAATVRDGAPAAARIRAATTATARLCTGEHVVVQVDLHVAGAGGTATGTVSVDDVQVYAGRWVAGPADQDGPTNGGEPAHRDGPADRDRPADGTGPADGAGPAHRGGPAAEGRPADLAGGGERAGAAAGPVRVEGAA
jgi:hypothetical protein